MATDVVKSDSLSDAQARKILSAAKNLSTSKTQGLCRNLLLKTSAKYMVIVNINTADGLVNGASGELMAIDINNQTIMV